ncbi:MAG TPA: hypothetical protein VGQ62_07525 [Chloroflexota bacterium]|jgi:hypothetical protein|nr:hypothetical protein [Chloroflexota bacterium]
MPDDFVRALFDPTAPLPQSWPGGVFGIFLLFCLPVGGGIPLGVIMARDAGLSPLLTAGLYLASDVVLAVTTEPMLALLRWLSKRVAFLARLGHVFGRLTGTVGLQEGGVRGPLGLILLAFSVSPTTGRAAAAAAGHGFFSGWTLAILGDMAYFGVLMATTLWVSSMFGDDRLTIGAVLIGTWVLPLLIRRLRGKRPTPPGTSASARSTRLPAAMAATALTPLPPASPMPAAARVARKRSGQTGRRRRTRGLHS